MRADHAPAHTLQVERYLRVSAPKTHSDYTLKLIELFTVEREGEKERYAKHKDNHNRQLLWHGSRLTNWMGILSQGLRIAPPEAPVTVPSIVSLFFFFFLLFFCAIAPPKELVTVASIFALFFLPFLFALSCCFVCPSRRPRRASRCSLPTPLLAP